MMQVRVVSLFSWPASFLLEIDDLVTVRVSPTCNKSDSCGGDLLVDCTTAHGLLPAIFITSAFAGPLLAFLPVLMVAFSKVDAMTVGCVLPF
jgi:hypothetical protein